MDLRSCSVSSTDSLLSSSSASTADRMGSVELEAAEALADLAHLAMRESGSGGGDVHGGNKWGTKRKRAMKRVKSESPPDDSVSNSTPLIDSVPAVSDLATDLRNIFVYRAVMNPNHGEPICTNAMMNTAKTETDADLPKPSPNGSKCYMSFGGGRSRQNLTEAEKEARRLRRILANRESARQTIRRRQALCEELTRKAADLSWENENLKREKELALKEFQALETTNKHLKAQIAAKVIKAEVGESPGHPKSACIEVPINLATNRPYLLYNHHSFSPICWPSVIQSSNAVQPHHQPKNAIFIPSNYPMPTNGKLDSSQKQQENPINVGGPRGPLYMLSHPWFFPVPDHGNGLHPQPSAGFKHINDENSASNGCTTMSSSTAGALTENQHCSLPVKVKPEASALTEVRVINDLNETPAGFSPDEGGECADPPHTQEMILASVGLNPVIPAVTVKNESGLTGGIIAKASRLLNCLPEKGRDTLKFPSKKSVDAAAAAEARKRRKELTKLKNLYGRQCRMNC